MPAHSGSGGAAGGSEASGPALNRGGNLENALLGPFGSTANATLN